MTIDEHIVSVREDTTKAIDNLSAIVMGKAFLDCFTQEHCERLQSALSDLLSARTKFHRTSIDLTNEHG